MVLLRLCELLSTSKLFKDCQCERRAGKRRLLKRRKKVSLYVALFHIISLFIGLFIVLNVGSFCVNVYRNNLIAQVI